MRLHRMYASLAAALVTMTALTATSVLTGGAAHAAEAAARPNAPAAALAVYYRFRNLINSKCLDADAFSGWNGTKVQLWDCSGGYQQDWIMVAAPDPNYKMLQNRLYPWMCLNADNSAGSYPNGAALQLWDCSERTDNAAWKWVGTSSAPNSPSLMFSKANAGMVVDGDVSQGTNVNGMKVQMYDDRWDAGFLALNQLWTSSVILVG